MSADASKPKPIAKLNRLHHAAWVTNDKEATRHFYEDVIGLPMTACWKEKTPAGVEYCHTSFEIGDGGAIVVARAKDGVVGELLGPIRISDIPCLQGC